MSRMKLSISESDCLSAPGCSSPLVTPASVGCCEISRVSLMPLLHGSPWLCHDRGFMAAADSFPERQVRQRRLLRDLPRRPDATPACHSLAMSC